VINPGGGNFPPPLHPVVYGHRKEKDNEKISSEKALSQKKGHPRKEASPKGLSDG
jgi:hypothetical protein